MKKILHVLGLAASVNSLAEVTWTGVIDQENCDAVAEVKDDENVIYTERLHFPGEYGLTACFDSRMYACLVGSRNDKSVVEAASKGGKQTFKNSKGQTCYFEKFDVYFGNMGCFSQHPDFLSYMNLKVSCEESSSIPLYCAKSEKMARQVLLAREELACKEKDGAFEGDVYPFERVDGSMEYCVSASCDICDTRWRDDYMNRWKMDECCKARNKEPNLNNGTCMAPLPPGPEKIGVNYSKITALPGCSEKDAGEGENFCEVPKSSSSESSSSMSSSSISSSSVPSSSSFESSSSGLSSSSSEKQEPAKCFPSDDEADVALLDVRVTCESKGGVPNYSLDEYNCLVGDCSMPSSSSRAKSSSSVSSSSFSSSSVSSSSISSSSSMGVSSSSKVQSSSSISPSSSSKSKCGDIVDAYSFLYNAEKVCRSMGKESGYYIDDNNCLAGNCIEPNSSNSFESSSSEGQCIDVSLLKKGSDIKNFDKWEYVGKEKYITRKINYKESTANTSIYDALGRMYKKIKTKIKYYVHQNIKAKKITEVSEELEVWKKKGKSIDGQEYVVYKKNNKNYTIIIDSSVYKNGSYSVEENNFMMHFGRLKFSTGLGFYEEYDEYGRQKKGYYLRLSNDDKYDSDGNLKPFIRKVQGDTSYIDFDYFERKLLNSYTPHENTNKRFLLKTGGECPELNIYGPNVPNPICLRYEKKDISEKDKKRKYYSPGEGSDPTFGSIDAEPSKKFRCECVYGKKGFFHTYKENELLKNIVIVVMASNWKYESLIDDWNEQCWKTEDMKLSFQHEIDHMKNAIYMLEQLFAFYMRTSEYQEGYETIAECENEGKISMDNIVKSFDRWSKFEYAHIKRINDNNFKYPSPPTPTPRNRNSILCKDSFF